MEYKGFKRSLSWDAIHSLYRMPTLLQQGCARALQLYDGLMSLPPVHELRPFANLFDIN